MAGPDFTVIADAIRSAAGLAATAGEAAEALQLGAVATTISGALGGTTSAAAANELSGAWDTAISTWSTDVRGHAQRLTDSAAAYEANEGANETTFRSTGPTRAV